MKLKILTSGVALVLLVVAAYLIWPEKFGFCETRVTTVGEICRSPLEAELGDPLLPFALVFFAFSVITLATTRATWRKWIKFSLWCFAAAAAIITLLLNSEMGFVGGLSVSDAGGLALLLVIPYSIASAILLFVEEQSEKSKRKSS